MPFVKVNDIELYYELQGDGPPLILIAGFAAHSAIWKDYIAPLSKQYQLLIFDNRGAGQSEAPEIPYSIEMMAEDIVALMEALKISNAHFLGLSMGGAIVLQLCIEHPDKVKKAIVAGAFAKLPETAKWQIQASRKLLEAGMPFELFLESLLPWLFSNAFLSDTENVKKQLHQWTHNPYPQSPAGYYGQSDAILQLDLRDRLKEIQCKTLVIAGEEDLYIPSSCFHQLMKRIPNAKLAVLKEQAHMFVSERPEEVIKLVKEFLG
ncbi:MAG TPA: alpha/beta hydrolase [Rhabdochlamydiaceae bacterium]|nr:alpha/beta hydrolase [Rhabdochlamydiaceae bacterium]